MVFPIKVKPYSISSWQYTLSEIGPINVTGLSIDKVKSKLTSALAKIYLVLKEGNTS